MKRGGFKLPANGHFNRKRPLSSLVAASKAVKIAARQVETELKHDLSK